MRATYVSVVGGCGWKATNRRAVKGGEEVGIAERAEEETGEDEIYPMSA